MSTLRTNNIANAAGSGLPNFNGVAGNRLTPTAWANFNGTGVVAIRDSYNIASITDLNTGNYRPNFITPMDNVNYAVVFGGNDDAVNWYGAYEQGGVATHLAASFSMVTVGSGAAADRNINSFVVFGGKA